ncbi:hypothetical protein AAF712_016334 [Marasmius tenuissimus]|uniref:NmrA-like domain-containing protein n=1 Tax=Marasmius tenuissimus TaxID=585030 RepID=A0ABR2Z987_9AGAR
MSSSKKQLVFIVGATGRSGSSIARALIKHPEKFEVKAIVRPSSVDKPIITELKSLGVKIVTGDITNDDQESLKVHLKDVDTVIITVIPLPEGQQDNIIRAAKAANVKRLVPSDFATYATPGSMQFQDMKVRTQNYIIDNNIPHTFIQVGMWPDASFPFPHAVNGDLIANSFQKQFNGPGNVKTSWTALERVGEFVARIIADPRTLNKTVHTWDGEFTLDEAYALASKLTGENFDDYPRVNALFLSKHFLTADGTSFTKVTLEEIEAKCDRDLLTSLSPEYSRSIWFRGENTLERAVAAGALDARALYPDYKPLSLEEWARGFYEEHGALKN